MKFLKILGQLVLIIGTGVAAVWAVSYLSPKATSVAPVPKPAHEAKEDLEALALISPDAPFTNSVIRNEDGRNKFSNTFRAELSVKGTVVGGYIYAVGNVEGDALHSTDRANTDDIFVNLIELAPNEADAVQHAGHLVASRSLEVEKKSDKTEFLFSLADISVVADYLDPNNAVLSLNWLPVLKEGKSLAIEAANSTYKPSGTIERLVLYYECLENTECSIEVVE